MGSGILLSVAYCCVAYCCSGSNSDQSFQGECMGQLNSGARVVNRNRLTNMRLTKIGGSGIFHFHTLME